MDVKSHNKILSDVELHKILKQAIRSGAQYEVVQVHVRPAFEGLAGFLGDHLRMTVEINCEGDLQKINLFIKAVPNDNEMKAAFINDGKFFSKEAFVLELLEEIASPGPDQWCTLTYLKNDKIVVMPDLAIDGYSTRPIDKPFDLPHTLLTSVSLARFHGAFTNYQVKKSLSHGKTYNILEEQGDLLIESTFLDNPWTRTGATLHTNYLSEFSAKYKNISASNIFNLYLKAFDTLQFYDNTLNVLIHKDLWANNIMFKYVNGEPTNALLIDFQLVRYCPPAFDIMIFLYMTTTRDFRSENEETILKNYFDTFVDTIDNNSKRFIETLDYDWENFCSWCERARMLAMVVAILICPFGLINAKKAETEFNDQSTFEKIMNEDRTKPIVGYAKENHYYRIRMLELYEEFVERYMQNE